MRKLQLWAILKEICREINDWDIETFEKNIGLEEMTFVKDRPKSGDWNSSQKVVIRIIIEKHDVEEEKK